MGVLFSSEIKPATPSLTENINEPPLHVPTYRSVKKYKTHKVVIQPNVCNVFQRHAVPLYPIQEHERENYPESPKEEAAKVYDNQKLQQIGYLSGTDFYDLKKVGQDTVMVTDDIILRKTHKKVDSP